MEIGRIFWYDWQKEKRDYLQVLSRISTLPRSNTGEATNAITRSGQIVSVSSTPQAFSGSSSMEIVPQTNRPTEEKKASVYAEVVRSLNSASERALSFKPASASKIAFESLALEASGGKSVGMQKIWHLVQTLVGEDVNIQQNISRKMVLVNGARRHLEWGHLKHVIETIQNHPVQNSKPMAEPSPNEEDYSASATLIHFDRPLPLLRRPIPAAPTDDPELGPFVLAFPNRQSFFSSLKFCESKLLVFCEAGVRIGCSITASNNCKPPWWKTLFGKIDFKERNECEEREMAACLQGSKEKCGEFSKEKCLGPFGSARIACRDRKLRKKEVGELISWVSGFGLFNGNLGFELLAGNQLGLLSELDLSYEVTNFRGSELLGDRNQPN